MGYLIGLIIVCVSFALLVIGSAELVANPWQKEFDMCSKRNISKVTRTPFHIHSSKYPAQFRFQAKLSCNCRVYVLEPFTFSIRVTNFITTGRDRIAIKTKSETTYVTSEDKAPLNPQSNLTNILLTFATETNGTGSFWMDIESERTYSRSIVPITMHIVCQPKPFGDGRNRSVVQKYVLQTALIIGIVIFVGLLVAIPLFFMWVCQLCCKKPNKGKPDLEKDGKNTL